MIENSELADRFRPKPVIAFAEMRNPAVKQRLIDPLRTGGAVLRWAVAGAVAYRARGLGNDPDNVRKATEEYRLSQDRINGFVEDELLVTCDQSDHILAGELYARYQQWCDRNGERFPLAQRTLGLSLRNRGCEPCHNPSKTARLWTGVKWRGADDPA